MDVSNLAPETYPPASTVVASLGLTFFAFTGFQIVSNSVADMAEPRRELPLAMYGSIVVAIILYALTSIMVFGNLGTDEVVKQADVAIAVAAQGVIGQWGVVLSVIAAAFATVSTVLANLYFGLNTSYSLAIDGRLPSRYARRAWKGATHGLVLTALVAVGLVAFLDVEQIASAGSIVYMVVFFMINVGHMRLRSETGASLGILAAGTLLLAVAAIPFLFSTWENEPVVVWFTVGSLVAAVMLESYLSGMRHRRVPVPDESDDHPDG